jgi:hypothetical protein
MFHRRTRARPSSTPETVCQTTFGTSAAAAISASCAPTPSVATPQATMIAPPAMPSTAASAKARCTSDRSSRSRSRIRFVTAIPSWPSSRDRIVTERTTSTNVPRPDGARNRLWITTSRSAIGVESPRNSSVSTMFLPTWRPPGTSRRGGGRGRFGATGGAASIAGAGRTASPDLYFGSVVAISRPS